MRHCANLFIGAGEVCVHLTRALELTLVLVSPSSIPRSVLRWAIISEKFTTKFSPPLTPPSFFHLRDFNPLYVLLLRHLNSQIKKPPQVPGSGFVSCCECVCERETIQRFWSRYHGQGQWGPKYRWDGMQDGSFFSVQVTPILNKKFTWRTFSWTVGIWTSKRGCEDISASALRALRSTY